MARRRTSIGQSITADGLARLLARLDGDRDRAAAEYERLRLLLVKFFDWRGAWSPDECADETLDRLAAKLELRTTIDDVQRYAYGVARHVLMEQLRRQAQTPVDGHADLASLHVASTAGEASALHDCFARCLDALPEESRALVLEYYGSDGTRRIDDRQRLGRSLNLSDNALRSRVHRVRHRLERCVRACVDAGSTHGRGGSTTNRPFATRSGEDE